MSESILPPGIAPVSFEGFKTLNTLSPRAGIMPFLDAKSGKGILAHERMGVKNPRQP